MDLFKLGNSVIYLTSSLEMDVNGFNLSLLQITLQWTMQTILCECVSAFVVQISGNFPVELKNIEQIFEELKGSKEREATSNNPGVGQGLSRAWWSHL